MPKPRVEAEREMSSLDVSLCVVLAVVMALLFRMYRKQLILRHVFVRSSDWCAN